MTKPKICIIGPAEAMQKERGQYEAEITRLTAELAQTQQEYDALVARVGDAMLGQCGWEDDEDIVLFNGAPIGGTITRHNREFDRWWPAVKAALLKPEKGGADADHS